MSARIGRLFLVAAVVMLLGGAQELLAQFRGPARPQVRGVVKSVDANAGMITVSVVAGRGAADGRAEPTDRSYPVSKTAEIVSGDSGGQRIAFVVKEAKLSELIAGDIVTLTLTADQAVVEGIAAEGPTIRGVLKSVDLGKNSVTVTTAPTSRDQPAGDDKNYTLASDAEIAVDDGRGRRFSIKEGKLADLAAGALVTVRLSLDQKHIISVTAEGPSLFGVVKSFDASRNLLTVSLGPSRGGEGGGERIVELASDATVMFDDGRGRRLSLKEAKASEIPMGAAAFVRLTADQRYAKLIRAEGPSVPGLLRSVDAINGTVTFATRFGRGENPEEKTLPVAKDVRVVLEGNEGKLGDIKVSDNGPFATLRLSLDQKLIQSVSISPGR